MNWWVHELSDSVHWDVDGLGIIDPRQIGHIIDLLDALADYGLQSDIVDAAFYKFKIEDVMEGNQVMLRRTRESLFDTEESLFVLPDVVDEEKGPYADFVNHVTSLRVQLLNDLIEFKQNLTIDELEEEIRERQNNDFMEGKSTHFFTELTDILEYVPDGYELDSDDSDSGEDKEEEIDDSFPEIEDEPEEKIEEDETMKWDEDEEDEEEKENDEDDSAVADEDRDDELVGR